MLELRQGQRVGGWEIERVLSFGTPTLAACHQVDAPDTRAVLRVTKQHKMAQTWQDREVAGLKAMDHPAIPQLLDNGRDGPLLFIALRPFPTETLADRLLAGPVEGRQACTWLMQIARAIQYMHHQGWAHGDVNPQHIYVGDRDAAFLMGMVSARRVDEEARFRTETPKRNLTYLAPEALVETAVTPPRADLYALGCVAYELLSGEPPFPAAAFAGRNDQDRMFLEWKTRAQELDPGPNHPDWLRFLVRKCTHPDPAHRLPDIDSVVAWLEASRASWSLPEPPEPTPMVLARHEPPAPLQLQPRLDTAKLAHEIAMQSLELQRQQRPPQTAPRADVGIYLYVAATAGLVAGLAASVLLIVYTELAYLI